MHVQGVVQPLFFGVHILLVLAVNACAGGGAALLFGVHLLLVLAVNACAGGGAAPAKPKGLLGSFMNSIAMRVVGKQVCVFVLYGCWCA